MGWIDPVTRAVVPPIHMASTYLRDEDGLVLAEAARRRGSVLAKTRPSNSRRAVRTTLATIGASIAGLCSATSRQPLGCSSRTLPGSGRLPAMRCATVPSVTHAVEMPTAPVIASAL